MQITIRDKAAIYPVGHGYSLRKSATPSSVISHTTNNRNRTSFASEVKYLFESPDVSAHYLIGKTAREGVVQFLEPARYSAWHAGRVLPGFENEESIGIEKHVSLGEAPTQYQMDTEAELVRSLMERFSIPLNRIDTHRAVALPAKRKTDPEGWEDAAFYAWRAALAPSQPSVPTDPWAIWRERWGSIATPTDDAWQYAIPVIYRANDNWKRLGKCESRALYDNGNAVIVQCFAGGDIRCRGDECEIVVLVAKQ